MHSCARGTRARWALALSALHVAYTKVQDAVKTPGLAMQHESFTADAPTAGGPGVLALAQCPQEGYDHTLDACRYKSCTIHVLY